ncbi:MAG TPA: Ku protein [Stellaceae bacterium]|jgi:DNA end-binding protein Ku|nr:Ku protein [Stellaceae bacterium]
MPHASWNGCLRLSLVFCPVYLSLATEEGELSKSNRDEFQTMSSDVIDLVHFVNRNEIDPLYLNTSYYVHPDGELAAEPFRVIAEKMTAKGLVGIGRVTLANTRRLVMFEPCGAGMVMFTLRNVDEVRVAEFDTNRQTGIDPEMLDIIEAVVEQRRSPFDPAKLLNGHNPEES